MKKAAGQRRLAQQRLSYTAYGDSPARVSAGLGFNGELRDEFMHAYTLGNGHRCYCAALMRFFSPDALSPFDKGGVNAYAYCQGDPINHLDPTGGVPVLKHYPGRARRVVQVRPVKAILLAAVPVRAILGPVHPVSKKGPGQYLQARMTSRELVKFGGSELTAGFGGASVKPPPVQAVAAGGPTIDQLGDYWRNHWHWEHRPGPRPMRLDEMIPNHQRAHSSQIAEIEHTRAVIREQNARREIDVQVLASFGHW